MTTVSRSTLFPTLLMLIAALLPSQAQSSRTPTPKVLIIGVDGLRPDAVQAVDTPNMDLLVANGAVAYDAKAGDETWSGPGWSTILTGVWRDKHGVRDNTFVGKNYGDYPEFMHYLERKRPELYTVRINSWLGIEYMESGADEAIFLSDTHHNDTIPVNRAIEVLRDPERDVDLMFIYFSAIDHTGHGHGFGPYVPRYRRAIEVLDQQLGRLMREGVQARSSYEQEDWLVLLTTDHGGHYRGHGTNLPEDRRIIFLASGPSVKKGVIHPAPMQTDIVPTALAHLNVEIDRSAVFDGRPVALQSAPSMRSDDGNLLVNGGGEFDRGLRDYGWDVGIRGWEERGGVALIQYGSRGFPIEGAVPLSDTNFFAGGERHASSMTQTVALPHAVKEPTTFTLSAYLGGYEDDGDTARVTARFYNDEAVAACSGRGAEGDYALLMRGENVWRFDRDADRAVWGYPKRLDEEWPVLALFPDFAGGIDAALNDGNGHIHLFAGPEVIVLDVADGSIAKGPIQISTLWPGLEKLPGGAMDIDGAANWGNGKAYFFKGVTYARFDLGDGRVDSDYPRYISKRVWRGLHVWPYNIDAILHWGLDEANTKAYFFKEGEYLRYDTILDRGDAGYPLPINDVTWPGLDDWRFGERTARLAPVTAQERAGRTGFLYREVQGEVPMGTSRIEVEVRFTQESGRSDGYADNIALRLNPAP